MRASSWMPRWKIYKAHDGWIILDPAWEVPRLERWYPTFEHARAAFAAGPK